MGFFTFLLGALMASVAISAGFFLVKTSQAYRSHKASFDPNVMLRQASWDGDGKYVACLTCCTELTVHNIASVDEDGNARCKRCMS